MNNINLKNLVNLYGGNNNIVKLDLESMMETEDPSTSEYTNDLLKSLNTEVSDETGGNYFVDKAIELSVGKIIDLLQNSSETVSKMIINEYKKLEPIKKNAIKPILLNLLNELINAS